MKFSKSHFGKTPMWLFTKLLNMSIFVTRRIISLVLENISTTMSQTIQLNTVIAAFAVAYCCIYIACFQCYCSTALLGIPFLIVNQCVENSLYGVRADKAWISNFLNGSMMSTESISVRNHRSYVIINLVVENTSFGPLVKSPVMIFPKWYPITQ